MEQEEAAGSQLMYSIERPVYDEAFIRSQLLHHKENSTSLCQRLANQFRCSSEKAKAVALSFLPILTWLPNYPLKQYLFSDVVSGLSTGVVQLPQGLAYAMLAALPPVYGLYSSFYPVLLYTFFGTSRHISIGTFAVISLMIGGVVVREVPDSMFYVLPANGSNVTAFLDVKARDDRRVQVAIVLTTLVGIIQFALGLLRFGFVAIYLTEPLVRGFTTAAAVHVVISQLKYLLGVKTQRFSGPLSAIFSIKAVFSDITSTNISTLILGLGCIVFLYGIKDLNERFKKKLPIPIPGEIIVVIVSTSISYGMSLSDDYKVDVVGEIPTGLRSPAIPEFSLLPNLVTDSFAVAIVGFSMGISLAKIFALKHGYSVDGNQELIALGLCNFISSFFQTFAITCSMSRSLVQESTGGKTQIAGLLASLVVLLVVVAIGFVFEPLPQVGEAVEVMTQSFQSVLSDGLPFVCWFAHMFIILCSVPQTALAAIIMVNLIGMFKQFRDIPTLWRTSKIELVIWLVAFVASVLLGLDYGLLVAIAFAILTVIYRTQSPKNAILGHVPGTGLYCDVDEYEETGVNPVHLQASRKARKKQMKANGSHNSPMKVCAKYKEEGVTHEVLPLNLVVEEQRNDLSQPQVETSVLFNVIPVWIHAVSKSRYVSLQVIKEYAAVDVEVVIAGCSRNLLSELDTLQFFTGIVTPEMVFPTVHDAVLRCQNSNSRPLQPMTQPDGR
ncbi:Prestin [Larimichthys crocea]|uniref:Uncharacterized protein n=1 Tax=Larimichthys crocea TaxID=215358 RepID=A0ACD3Q7Z7_LARCR|nr:Prestin [Larimichthys crocea]